MILQLAWRNIWRNKRRSLITISAVAFAVFFASFMTSFNRGVWDAMIDGAIQQYFGYAQIHKKGYWDDKTIDNAISFSPILKNIPQQVAEVEDIIPRIESFALASAGDLSAGAFVIGIDPAKEQQITYVKDKLIEGNYLTKEGQEIIIAEGLAEKLKLQLGDTLVLISQGYRGANAAGKYPIKGIIKMGLPDLNRSLIYMPLATASYLFAMEDKVTTLVLNIKNQQSVPAAMAGVQQHLQDATDYELMDWQALLPELLETKALKEGGNYVFIGILYLLIGFAIFGTILMMTKERSYEFGVLTAIGMQKGKLFSIVWLETIMVAMVGAITGILMSMPLVYYLQVKPLKIAMIGQEAADAYEKFGLQDSLPAAFDLNIFFTQAFIIFLLTSILAIYPWWKISSSRSIDMMRNG